MMIERQETGNAWLIRWGLATLLIAMGNAAGAGEQPTSQAPEAAPTANVVEAPATAPAEVRAEPWILESPRLAGGRRAYIDPQTGILVNPPLKVRREISSQLEDLFSTSHEGLEVIELRNGYSYVDLLGRFHSATMATVGADGEVKIHHGLPVPNVTPKAGAEAAPSNQEDQP